MGVYVVTGAAGFIGSVVAGLMLREGHTVFGIDNLSPVYDVRVKEHRLQALLPQENFHFIRDDITDRDFIARLAANVPKADAVVNLAAIAGVRASATDPWSYLNTNTLGNLNMLEYARHQRVPKFILASTSSLYGNEGKP
ncbi:MAG: SDR family NAD(P)-dependent oxidoreductase, partial [Chloroflexi bacterium]|nr:SDR family NAD(P)-dependent oxidoreductase [Chloroflexota bacterium]